MPGLALFDYAGSFQNGFDKAKQEKQRNGLAGLAADYAQGGQPDYQGIAANGGDPLRFRDDQQKQQEAKFKRAAEFAGLLLKLPAEQQGQAWESVVKPGLNAVGLPVDGPWDAAKYLPVAEQLSQQFGGQSGTGVQSSFVDAQGRRMAIMRDGTVRELGQNAESYRPIEGAGGIYGFNTRTNAAAPTMVGGPQAQAPQQPRVQFDFAPGTSPEVMGAMRSYAAADRPGAVEVQPAQQLQPAPKAASQNPEEFGQPQTVMGPDGKPTLVQFGNQGGQRPVAGLAPGPTAREARPPTESERNAAGYLDRMVNAERELEAVVGAGYEAGNLRDKYTAGNGLMNYFASDQGQQYRQQQEDWVRAKLRKESGAVIGDDEMEREIRTYFPQPGDTPQTISNKKKSRDIAINAMRTGAGRAITDESQTNGPPQAPNVIRYDAQGNRIQ